MWQLLRRLNVTGLRARLLGIVLAAVLPLTVLLFVYAGIESNAAQDRARADVQRSLLNDAQSIRDLVAESRATLATFGITYAIQGRHWDLAQGNADRLKALHVDYAVIAVADPTGGILVSSTDQTRSVSVADQRFFRRAVSTGALSVSEYVVDPLTRRPALVVSYPVYDPDHKLIAVEFIGFDPTQVSPRLASAGTSYSTELLVDSGGRVIARQPTLQGVVGNAFAGNPLVRTMLAGKQGDVITTGIDGLLRHYYYAPVFQGSEGTLYLATGFSEDQFLAGQRRALGLVLLGFGAFALLALGVAWLVGTFSIYAPVRQLERATALLSAGDLSARSSLSHRRDEIGALGREFDDMAQAIETQVHELERAQEQLSGLNAGLERRVRLRTADLEASNKELEAFNYSVSHDLRAPLRAIDGFSQALLEDYADKFDDEGRGHLERIKAAANRMGELIDSLLALSRLSRCAMETQVVDLSELALEVTDGLRHISPDRQVDVAIQPGVVAQCDPVLLRTVLENLLGNAWKFTGRTEKARIEFGVTEADGEPVYFVRDNGAGFDMAYSSKLFGAFQRLHGQAEFPGLGIGLATVGRVIGRHGGRVWAQGEPDEGATFFFTL